MRTGCFVKICPLKVVFKIMTLALLWSFFLANNSFAQSIIDQEKTSTYLRLNLLTGRDQLQFSRHQNKVSMKMLNEDLYLRLKAEFETFKADPTYINKISFVDNANGGSAINAMAIEIELKDTNVEMFSFYRERDKKYVVDFWHDKTQSSDEVKTNNAAVLKPEENKELIKPEIKELTKNEATANKVVAATKTATKIPTPAKKVTQNKVLEEKIKSDKDLSRFIINPYEAGIKSEYELDLDAQNSKTPYRDYRYGATFIWDYEPIIPSFKQIVNLKSKVPEAFFPIENRKFDKNDREAHLQLTINFYRQKKWGLMYKSMKLFEQKYGQNADWEIREYLKANAILKENIENPNDDLIKNALSIFSNLMEKSDNYEMKKAIYKYFLAHYMDSNEPLKILQLAKTYYAGTRDSFDFEESAIPAEAMLNALAKLGQIDQIKELVQEKTMKKVLSAQLLLSYQSYAYLKAGELEKLVGFYESHKTALTGLVEPVIMYNTAEAYFRLGRFNEALALYQDFTKNYSYEYSASNANLRIALCYDLLDKNYDETIALYKKAIDLSVDGQISYEARVRYVGFRSVRKKELDERDREFRIFLEQDKNTQKPDKNLSKLLHQVRLRTLIVDGKFKEALSYLTLIPTAGMSKIDSRVFDGDGAEIVYGYLLDFYKKAQHAQAIKVWQTYKDKYLDKVAMDPYINFVVGSSYVKLGLYKGFDDVYANFMKLKDSPQRSYPIWVNRSADDKTQVLLKDLVIIKDMKLKNWNLVHNTIRELEKLSPSYNKINYYKGLVAFNEKKYTDAVSHFENYFARQDQRVIYDPTDVADMIQAYTDSIYELGDVDKFLKVSDAILNDTNSFGMDNAYIQNIRERIAYLGIEITHNKGTEKNFMLFEKRIKDFVKKHPKSMYEGRLSYLLGQAMLKNEKVTEAREVFTKLINDGEVSEYIKELAKSELGLLNLKEKTL